jgi:hypothetical protein
MAKAMMSNNINNNMYVFVIFVLIMISIISIYGSRLIDMMNPVERFQYNTIQRYYGSRLVTLDEADAYLKTLPSWSRMTTINHVTTPGNGLRRCPLAHFERCLDQEVRSWMSRCTKASEAFLDFHLNLEVQKKFLLERSRAIGLGEIMYCFILSTGFIETQSLKNWERDTTKDRAFDGSTYFTFLNLNADMIRRCIEPRLFDRLRLHDKEKSILNLENPVAYYYAFFVVYSALKFYGMDGYMEMIRSGWILRMEQWNNVGGDPYDVYMWKRKKEGMWDTYCQGMAQTFRYVWSNPKIRYNTFRFRTNIARKNIVI